MNSTTSHGDPNIVCTPIKWYQIFVFLATNYFSHAATVKSYPGEKLHDTVIAVTLALFFPYSGICRGFEAIWRHASFKRYFEHDDLQMALQAGALCIVVRSEAWTLDLAGGEPIKGALVEYFKHDVGEVQELHPVTQGESRATNLDFILSEHGIRSGTQPNLNLPRMLIRVAQPWCFDQFGRNCIPGITQTVHGTIYLPPGYTFAALPSNAVVLPKASSLPEQKPETNITCSINIPKVMIAIIQSGFGVITLYRTRGDQLSQYGYAAFGLTVIPYVIMSLINLLGSLLTPDFPAMYVVESEELEEARKNHGVFDGTCGVLQQNKESDPDYPVGVSRVALRQDDEVEVTGIPAELSERYRDMNHTGRGANEGPSHPNAGYLFRLHMLKENGTGRGANEGPSHPNAGYLFRSRMLKENGYLDPGWACSLPPCTPFAGWGIPESPKDVLLRTRQLEQFVRKRVSTGPAEIWYATAAYPLLAMPYGIIGALTHFHAGHSTVAQRVWMMMWLTLGIVFGLGMDPKSLRLDRFDDNSLISSLFKKASWLPAGGSYSYPTVLSIMLYAAPAIGGMVVVCQMLQQYGECVAI